MASEDVERLFADLFEFVLHPHDEFLDAGMVGLRTGSVDLTTHFLDYEAELAARERLGIDRVQKVPAVLAETARLLIDVQLLEIEDKFLLEAGRVDLLPQLA